MTKIDVTFIGICTHLWENQPNVPPNPAWGTRIVVPNASDPNVIKGINDKYHLDVPPNTPIEPHVAKIHFLAEEVTRVEGGTLTQAPNDVLELILNGVTVTVSADASNVLQKDARCMPGLGSFVTGIGPGEAATSKDPAQASCYFDFTTGLVLGRALSARDGAGSILYTASTTGEPTMTITPFDGTPPVIVHLEPSDGRDTVSVSITNFPESGSKDNDNDFVLQYLAADRWPDTIPQLGPIGCTQQPNGTELLKRILVRWDFGVGCSNSNIP